MNELPHSIPVPHCFEGFCIVSFTWLSPPCRQVSFNSVPNAEGRSERLDDFHCPSRSNRRQMVPLRELDAGQGCRQRLRAWLGIQCSSSFSAALSNLLNFMLHMRIVIQNNHLGDYTLIWEMSESLTIFGISVRNFLQSQFTQEHHCVTVYICQNGGRSLYKAIKQGTSLQDRPTCLRIN